MRHRVQPRGAKMIMVCECRERTPNNKKHTLPFFEAVRAAAAIDYLGIYIHYSSYGGGSSGSSALH